MNTCKKCGERLAVMPEQGYLSFHGNRSFNAPRIRTKWL